MEKSELEQMRVLFRVAFFLAKSGRPFTDFPGQIKLLAVNNVPVSETYANDKQARIFTDYIYESKGVEMIKEMSESEFFAILSDGSTDTSITDEEIVYVKYIKNGGELVNIALGKTVTQSSTDNENGIAEHAVDGDKSGNWLHNSCSHTSGLANEPWWRVDLAEIHCISRVVITNRQDCCSHKIETAVVLITNTVDEVDAIQCGSAIDQYTALQATISFECDENTLGRYVTVDKTETPVVLHMCEVEVFAPMIL
uniref:Fucolectin-like n=1 Tax=Saccoglossus kowalevskii TaxID=10224 RepID=A0ABM0MBQ2_SACKO|nr:PREDICTED: fucolectin-like [Saccoglossus kowalevskii]